MRKGLFPATSVNVVVKYTLVHFSSVVFYSRHQVERKEIEMYKCRNDARKFYQKLKLLTEGYKPGASSCKDEHENLVTNPQGC